MDDDVILMTVAGGAIVASLAGYIYFRTQHRDKDPVPEPDPTPPSSAPVDDGAGGAPEAPPPADDVDPVPPPPPPPSPASDTSDEAPPYVIPDEIHDFNHLMQIRAESDKMLAAVRNPEITKTWRIINGAAWWKNVGVIMAIHSWIKPLTIKDLEKAQKNMVSMSNVYADMLPYLKIVTHNNFSEQEVHAACQYGLYPKPDNPGMVPFANNPDFRITAC